MKEKLDRAIALMGQAAFLEEQVSRAAELQKRLRGRELIISVVGQFKRGKSSLINALLRDALLPVGIVPLTAAVTEIRQGDRFRAVVGFLDGSEREIGREELPDYISEQQNRNNQKQVAVVRLWTAHTPFGPGIALVDTPGVGSVHQHNTETSYHYIAESDAVLFLLSVDSPVSEVERDFLLEAHEHAAKFYFVVNKADLVSTDNLKEFLRYCTGVLSEAIGPDVAVYPVSAKSGEGISALTERLSRDLRTSRDELLQASVSIKLTAILAQAKAKLELYLKAAATPAGELEVKLAQIREKQLQLEVFSDEVQGLTARQAARLVERIQGVLDTKMAALQPDMMREAEQIYEALRALPSRQFEPKLLAALEGILRDRLIELNTAGLALLDEGYAALVAELDAKAVELARFVSEMVKDQFGLDFPVSRREGRVSERSDFHLRVGHGGGFFLDRHAVTHLLPKSRANQRIYACAMQQMNADFNRNKNNMVYNYGYKMQESLRLLCGGFAADIAQMGHELDGLLGHVERSRSVRRGELRQTEQRFLRIRQQLDSLG